MRRALWPLLVLGLSACAAHGGTLVDRASVDMHGIREIVLPHDVTVRKDGRIGRMELIMEKSVASPSRTLRLENARRDMGVAVRRNQYRLELAPFGPVSTGADRATLTVTVRIPDGIAVTRAVVPPDSPDPAQGWRLHTGD